MKRIAQYAAVIGAVVALLSGCSEGADSGTPPPAGTGTPQVNNAPQANNPPQAKAVTEPTVADSRKASANLPEVGRVTTAVLHESPARHADKSAGTLTAIMRSVEVDGRAMTVRFAVQWDNSGAPDSVKRSISDLGWSSTDLMVIDTANLVGYRPLCTHGGYGHISTVCHVTQLNFGKESRGVTYLPNHGLVEGGAVLPAPQGKPATVTVALGAPIPPFTAVPVTYR
ncbi:MAG: hypothetical protein FWF12_06640 [Betaproteobacteria bacterium]|nr:hypothetical protein [Betaproteobacteria bacterium]